MTKARQDIALHATNAVARPARLRALAEIARREAELLAKHLTRRTVLAKLRAKRLLAGERCERGALRQRQVALLAQSLSAAARQIPRFSSLRGWPADESIFDFLASEVGVTTKSDLVAARDIFYPNRGVRRPWWMSGKTSGTSGTPLEVFRDLDSVIWEEAFHIQSGYWAGVRASDPQAVLRGDLATLSEANSEMAYLWDPFGRQLFLATKNLSERTVGAMIDACKARRCIALRAYPSAADQFATLVDQVGEKLSFKSIITNSEPLYPLQREHIERTFNSAMFEIYGMAERVAYGTRCEHGHLHLNTDYSCVEILDEGGSRTDDYGFIVGTSFHNQAMPLLRYRLADRARWVHGACPCGRAYPRIELASGKVEDQLYDRDGMAISPSIVTFAFKSVSNILKAQVAQISRDLWEIRIVPGKGFSIQDEVRLLANLENYVSRNILYSVKQMTDIPPLPSGKYKWVSQEWRRDSSVSNLPQAPQ